MIWRLPLPIQSVYDMADASVYFIATKNRRDSQSPDLEDNRNPKLDRPVGRAGRDPQRIDSKLAELAGCRFRYAIFFSILSPLVGYIYTGRLKALGIFMASIFAVLVGVSYFVPASTTRLKKVQIPLGLSIGAIAAADNSRAILLARRRLQRRLKQSEPDDS